MSNVAIGTDQNKHYAHRYFIDPYHSSTSEYFCPNEKCRVKLILKNRGFEQKAYGTVNPYYSALPNKGHIDGCPFGENVPSRAELDKAGFTVDNFFSALEKQSDRLDTTTTGRTTHTSLEPHVENLLTTVGKLYTYCLQHSDTDTLPTRSGDVPIVKIFQHERNASYTGKRNSKRLVTLNFKNCNFKLDNTHEINGETGFYKIWTIFKHTDTTVPPGKYHWLCFRERDILLMKKICEKLTPQKKKLGDAPLPIVVAGEWFGHSCVISSRRQIFIP